MLGRKIRVRYFLAFWLFVLSGVAFLDRTNISIAGLQISTEYGLGNQRLGWIFSAFLIGYAGFQVPAGWLSARFGPRRVLDPWSHVLGRCNCPHCSSSFHPLFRCLSSHCHPLHPGCWGVRNLSSCEPVCGALGSSPGAGIHQWPHLRRCRCGKRTHSSFAYLVDHSPRLARSFLV